LFSFVHYQQIPIYCSSIDVVLTTRTTYFVSQSDHFFYFSTLLSRIFSGQIRRNRSSISALGSSLSHLVRLIFHKDSPIQYTLRFPFGNLLTFSKDMEFQPAYINKEARSQSAARFSRLGWMNAFLFPSFQLQVIYRCPNKGSSKRWNHHIRIPSDWWGWNENSVQKASPKWPFGLGGITWLLPLRIANCSKTFCSGLPWISSIQLVLALRRLCWSSNFHLNDPNPLGESQKKSLTASISGEFVGPYYTKSVFSFILIENKFQLTYLLAKSIKLFNEFVNVFSALSQYVAKCVFTIAIFVSCELSVPMLLFKNSDISHLTLRFYIILELLL